MSGRLDPTEEISELLESSSTPVLLKKALQLFLIEDAQLARDTADKLDELCERRLAAHNDAKHVVPGASAVQIRSAEELNERCDAITGRLMKYMGKLVSENQRVGGPQLVLFAAARSFICMCVTASTVEEGLRDAKVIFEDSLRDLAPILREMPEMGSSL